MEKIIKETNADTEIEMQRRGYFFADRTLGVSINLSKCDLDFNKLIRLPITQSLDYKKEIMEIAIKAFPYDRRFHIQPDCNLEVAKKELSIWIDKLDNIFVCFFKDILIGFLALKEIDKDTLFIHLAAVDEKYRLTGAATSLYANAIKYAKENGYKKLEGRISSQNTAVMNLYSYLGGAFFAPEDIFIGENNEP